MKHEAHDSDHTTLQQACRCISFCEPRQVECLGAFDLPGLFKLFEHSTHVAIHLAIQIGPLGAIEH